MLILLSLLGFGVLGGILLYRSTKVKSKTVIPLKNRNSQHAQLWNCLWEHIRTKFNLYQNPDGTLNGGPSAQEIFAIMRKEFGILNIDQILFVSKLVELLGQSVENQRKHVSSMSMPPDFFNKIKPSLN